MEPDFLVGKVLQDRWNWSINIQDGRERWEAGGDTVTALTTAEAALFNTGFAEREKAGHQSQLEGRVVINPRWGGGTVYPAHDQDPLIQQTSHPPDPPSVAPCTPTPTAGGGGGGGQGLPRLPGPR